MPTKKSKLRTASDVISRLKWESSSTDPSLVMVGYTDRIDGPMEKPVKDFTSANHGGDIPEHRILYFRLASDELPLAKQVLWDRAGRVDRIFQSGAGPDATISEETLQAVRDAMVTMKQKEIEREERRKERSKQRERRARKRAAGRTNYLLQDEQTTSEQSTRFHWHQTPWFVYQDAEWTFGSFEIENEHNEENGEIRHPYEIVVVTWNVLFDLFDDGLESEDHRLNDGQHLSEERWQRLSTMLGQTEADLISLQEVTPAFVRVLLDSDWVQDDYACSASPASTESVDPSGVLLLWRRTTMSPFGPDCALFQCSDYGRNRSMMAVMQSTVRITDMVIFAAAHLPADKAKEESSAQTVSRRLARKRELSSILGQIERLERQLCSDSHPSSTTSHTNVTPIIAGDFNCEDDELCDDYFAYSVPQNITTGTATLYRDSWSRVHCEDGGWTFDPTKNTRAARSSNLVGGTGERRRIDRIFGGPSQINGKNTSRDCHQLVPVKAGLIGNDTETSPPSDHYGVRVAFQMFKIRIRGSETHVARSLWAANVPSSPHYMVALILDSKDHESLKGKYDAESSLPLLHVTLLHGFVEADLGCLDLAKAAVGSAIEDACSSMIAPDLMELSGELSLLEHRASCTVVALPNEASEEQKWLDALYDSLRDCFLQCNEQEKRSASSWKPHVTLGVVGSSSAARKLIASWKDKARWSSSGESMAVRSIDMLKRGPSGLFQTIAWFPITSTRPPVPTTIDAFLSDAGSSMARYMGERAGAVLWRIERACQSVAACLSVEASVYVCGSIQLGAALLRLSDVDAVIGIQPQEAKGDATAILDSVNRDKSFMQKLFRAIKDDMPCIQGRLRPIARGSSAVLTIQPPDLPSIDLSLCICDANGSPMDDASRISWNSYMDGEHILASLVQSFGVPFLEVFQGALRIIKLWAHNHDVYGAATGFLGGGGWAIWLAQYALKEVKTESFDGVSPAEASLQLASDFFAAAAKHDPDSPISLSLDASIEHGMHHRTLAVLPPCSDGDFGRAMTQSTTVATLSELKRAATLSLSVSLRPRSAKAFVAEYPRILAMELYQASREGSIEMAELKALGSTNFLALLVLLEKKISPNLLSPKSKPLRNGREWNSSGTETGFVWITGLTGEKDEVESLLQQIELDLQSQLVMHSVRLGLEVLTHEEALQRMEE